MLCVRPVLPQAPILAVDPKTLPSIGAVDERYQSYNIEMLEVTGGRFWKPYAEASSTSPAEAQKPAATPAGMSADLYAYRPPKDLSNPRLRALAAALGPAYVRVSGTWSNSTYLPKADESLTDPPAGYNSILTRAQWKGVVDFAHATGSELVTSFAISSGTRDASGAWTPEEAQHVLDYTSALHGSIAAAEFMNEPTFATMGAAPKGYKAEQYGRDFHTFAAFARKQAPGMKIAGPGSIGETTDPSNALSKVPGFIPTPQLLKAMGDGTVDIFSYHAYGGVSKRCGAMGGGFGSTEDTALSEQWLARTDGILAYYKQQRDQSDAGKPIWLTETGETACGGNPWASTFLDSFRYLDQLGRLAKGGVQVVMHNTLAASDYGLLDENNYAPRPNYWAALLWRRLMGTTVLDAGVPLQPGLHVYAHCLRNQPGGVALLVIQTDREHAHSLQISAGGMLYALSAPVLNGQQVNLNGATLALGSHDELPVMEGVPSPAGMHSFAPGTITFAAFPKAGNKACR
jgi:heparanase